MLTFSDVYLARETNITVETWMVNACDWCCASMLARK
jgi:hypothetical protein